MQASSERRVPLPRSLLFLCDRNAVRSPFAEAAMRHRFGDRVRLLSAGVEAAEETDAFMVVAAREGGLDLTEHAPVSLDEVCASGEDLSDIEMIVALSPAAERLASEIASGTQARVLYWSVPDPSDVGETRTLRLAAYRACCARIRDAVAETFV